MRAIALVLLAILVIATTTMGDAYVIKPTQLNLMGTAKKGSYFWQPSRAIKVSKDTAALRFLQSPDDCDDRSKNDETICKYGLIYTTDGGATFQTVKGPEVARFCGSGGIVDEGARSITCMAKEFQRNDAEKSFSYDGEVYKFVPAGTFKSTRVDTSKVSRASVFTYPPAEVTEDVPPVDAFFGDTIIYLPTGKKEQQQIARNVELTLENGTALHAYYISEDKGATFNFVSLLPVLHGPRSALHIIADSDRIMALAGPYNGLTQSISDDRGATWGNASGAEYFSPLSATSSPHGTVLYGGYIGRPGLQGMIGGTKQGSEKMLKFDQLHNRMVARMSKEGRSFSSNKAPQLMTNYTEEALSVTPLDWGNCDTTLQPNDAGGCATSSVVTLFSFNDAAKIFVFYDKLLNGYAPAEGDSDQAIFGLEFSLNETTEIKAAEEKQREAERAAQKAKYAEDMKKAEEERRRAERREKRAKDKARRQAFHVADRPNIEYARKMMAEDGDAVIIRDVVPENEDIVMDLLFDELLSAPAATTAASISDGDSATPDL